MASQPSAFNTGTQRGGRFIIVQFEAFFQWLEYGFGVTGEALFIPMILNPPEQYIGEDHGNDWLFGGNMVYRIKIP
jgi:hypothetical protein